MINVIVTYTVKQDRVAENEKLVRAVYEELHEIGNPDVHYATFKKEDGRTFVHIAFFPDKEAQAVLGSTAAFQAFQADIQDRCETPPDAQPLSPVGSYNLSYP